MFENSQRLLHEMKGVSLIIDGGGDMIAAVRWASCKEDNAERLCASESQAIAFLHPSDAP